MSQKVNYALITLLNISCLVIFLTIFIIENKKNPSSSDSVPPSSPRRLLSFDADVEILNFSSKQMAGGMSMKNESLPEEKYFNYMRGHRAFLNFTHNEQYVEKNAQIVMHVVLVCYCFWMLAIICDEYFIASIHIFCQKLRIKHELASATFMTIATSSPEFCITCVGTFITDGNISIGTIVGSAIFNILAVSACCGFFARSSLKLDACLLSRDCMLYALSIVLLIAVIYDHLIMWYEAALMLLGYFIYLIIMYKNDAMAEKMRLVALKIKTQFSKFTYATDLSNEDDGEVTEITPLFAHAKTDTNDVDDNSVKLSVPFDKYAHKSNECASNPWRIPYSRNFLLSVLRWPITFILWCTIPDCRRFQKFYVLTFVTCVVWILFLSYLIASLITVVDSVMGFLFIGAGTSIPEAVFSVIVTSEGNADVGISNAIGSNIFDILFCLGLSWLLRTLIAPLISGKPWIALNSTGITYSALSLLATLAIFYLLFATRKFKLDRKVSVCCLLVYLTFLLFTTLLEFNLAFIPHINFLSSNGLI